MGEGQFQQLRDVVAASLAQEPPLPSDAAVAALALTYAQQIDDGGDASKLGPPLLACLEALHMSPRARAAARKGVTSDAKPPGAGKLDELRQRRDRKGRAASVDATTA